MEDEDASGKEASGSLDGDVQAAGVNDVAGRAGDWVDGGDVGVFVGSFIKVCRSILLAECEVVALPHGGVVDGDRLDVGGRPVPCGRCNGITVDTVAGLCRRLRDADFLTGDVKPSLLAPCAAGLRV
jgi:hypothetical protein